MSGSTSAATVAQMRLAQRQGWRVQNVGKERWALILGLWALGEWIGAGVPTWHNQWRHALLTQDASGWSTAQPWLVGLGCAVFIILFSGRSSEVRTPIDGPVFVAAPWQRALCAVGLTLAVLAVMAGVLAGAIRAIEASPAAILALWGGWTRRLLLVLAGAAWVGAFVHERLARRRLRLAAANLDSASSGRV